MVFVYQNKAAAAAAYNYTIFKRKKNFI